MKYILSFLLTITFLTASEENELTADEIAWIHGIHYVKGILPDEDGYRLKAIQLNIQTGINKSEKILGPIRLNYPKETSLPRITELEYPKGTVIIAYERLPDGDRLFLGIEQNGRMTHIETITDKLDGFTLGGTSQFPSGGPNGKALKYPRAVPKREFILFPFTNKEGEQVGITIKAEPAETLNSEAAPQN